MGATIYDLMIGQQGDRLPQDFRSWLEKYELMELIDESRFCPTNRHAAAAFCQGPNTPAVPGTFMSFFALPYLAPLSALGVLGSIEKPTL